MLLGSTRCFQCVKEDRYLYHCGCQPIHSSNEMKDQVEHLKVKQMKAVYGGDQYKMDQVYEAHYQMILLSPESLLITKLRDVLLSEVYQ